MEAFAGFSRDVRYWTDSVNVHHFFGVNLIYAHFNIANVKVPFGLYKGFRNEYQRPWCFGCILRIPITWDATGNIEALIVQNGP